VLTGVGFGETQLKMKRPSFPASEPAYEFIEVKTSQGSNGSVAVEVVTREPVLSKRPKILPISASVSGDLRGARNGCRSGRG
jgi:hypothetical protein